MKFRSFEVAREGNIYYLSKDSRPRVKLNIDCTGDKPQLKDIKFIDKCTAREIATVINEVELFLTGISNSSETSILSDAFIRALNL